MESIRENILKNELPAMRARFAAMQDKGLPKAMLAEIGSGIALMERGVLSVSGNPELLDLPAENPQMKVGRRGKQYVRYANGVCYFPNARFGRFISMEKEA